MAHMLLLLQDGLYEEAQVLRKYELELKRKLTTPATAPIAAEPFRADSSDANPTLTGSTSIPTTIPLVGVVRVADVEAVVSSWSGVPVQQMTADETKRLSKLEPTLKVCCSDWSTATAFACTLAGCTCTKHIAA